MEAEICAEQLEVGGMRSSGRQNKTPIRRPDSTLDS